MATTRAIIKMMRQMQKRRDMGPQKLESQNYAEMPWWNPKRWM